MSSQIFGVDVPLAQVTRISFSHRTGKQGPGKILAEFKDCAIPTELEVQSEIRNTIDRNWLASKGIKPVITDGIDLYKIPVRIKYEPAGSTDGYLDCEIELTFEGSGRGNDTQIVAMHQGLLFKTTEHCIGMINSTLTQCTAMLTNATIQLANVHVRMSQDVALLAQNVGPILVQNHQLLASQIARADAFREQQLDSQSEAASTQAQASFLQMFAPAISAYIQRQGVSAPIADAMAQIGTTVAERQAPLIPSGPRG